MTKEITLHRDDLVAIREFIEKYPDSDFINISVDSSSGIGSIVKASLPTVVNGDLVTISKTIVDESSW
jgi:hypothetical protein